MDGARNVLLRYLDAKQHLWNTYFVEKISDITQCEPVESFEAIDSLLFKVLVCQVLGFELPKSHVLGADVVPQIKVIARPQLTDIPIIFEGPRIDKNRHWEAPANFSTSGLEGQFIEFFQWNKYDYLSMPYVRLRMAAFPVQASRVGTDALIEIVNVDLRL
jgi:hypothetical protein